MIINLVEATAFTRRGRKHDHQHYLCGLFMDSAARRAVFAVRALNIEAALIRYALIHITLI